MRMTRISKLVAAVCGFWKRNKHHTPASHAGVADSGIDWKPVQRDERHASPYQVMSRTNAWDLYRTAPVAERLRVREAIDYGQLCVGFLRNTCYESYSGIRTNESGTEPEFKCLSCGAHWQAPPDH